MTVTEHILTELRDRLPSSIALASAKIEDRVATLFPYELDEIRRAVPSRRAEFSTGRWLARQLLNARGIDPLPIGKGPNGNPLWPDAVRGSISHSHDTCIAIVASAAEFLGVGVDIEYDIIADSSAQELILTRNERAQYHSPKLARLVFSAKESFFKAVFEHHTRYIDFHDVDIDLCFETSTFDVRTNVVDLDGRWSVSGVFHMNSNLAVTLCTIDKAVA